jgi:hypothetical protein
LLDIHLKLALAFDEEVYTLASVKYWIHEFKIGRTILTDQTRPGRLSIYYIDVFVLKQFDKIPLFQFNR